MISDRKKSPDKFRAFFWLKSKRIAIDVSGVIHRAKIHSGDKWLLQFINLMNKFSNSYITINSNF